MELLVDLCNLALMRLGNSETIDTLDDEKTTAKLCKALYRHVWDCVLRVHPWGFATRRAALVAASAPAPTNWAFSYAVPADCAFARSIVVPGLRAPRLSQATPFEIGRDADGAVCVFTDQADAELVYTAKVDPAFTAPEVFAWEDPLFNNAFAARLAWELAPSLGKTGEMAERAQRAYLAALSEAQARDMSEGQGGEDPEPDFLACRR